MRQDTLHPALQNPDVIRVSLYKPKDGDRHGTYVRDRYVTLEEFEAQVVACLKNIPCGECSAYDLAESVFNAHRYAGAAAQGDSRMTAPTFFERGEGRVFALPSRGNCEGYRIRFLLLRDDGTYDDFLSIKYLSDEEQVWAIAKRLATALDNGNYI